MDKSEIPQWAEDDFYLSVDKCSGNRPDTNKQCYADLTPCWGWSGSTQNGYGLIIRSKRRFLAHRLSYALHKGVIPHGMVVMHKCDNKICTNPDHLELGTNSQNVSDAHARGLCKKRGRVRNLASVHAVSLMLDAAWELMEYLTGQDSETFDAIVTPQMRNFFQSANRAFMVVVAENMPDKIGFEASQQVREFKRKQMSKFKEEDLTGFHKSEILRNGA